MNIPNKVAYLGPVGTYTHQAALNAYEEEGFQFEPQVEIKSVFDAVQNDIAIRGVVPVENSTNGAVMATLDLLADIQGRYPDIVVCGEVYFDVRHCLLGRSATRTESEWTSGRSPQTVNDPNAAGPKGTPRVSIKHIKRLYSHPQAWGQCTLFLDTFLTGVERVDTTSTSRAAELTASDSTGTSAAISSLSAAHVHGLEILAEGIQEKNDNKTRFFLIKKQNAQPSPFARPEQSHGTKDDYKSLVALTVRDRPGSLVEALAVFRDHDINLTSIQTRPSGTAPWNYTFVIEFVGLRAVQGGSVNRALADLGDVVEHVKWLGCWHKES
ncbi:PDT-domain-containing protein [Patellaria atrata CBS 101060]|uniref:prephenate dehydratase n=1 Tax=Patellaria atrata CBS 101060 TaxID=1346257 RepID=A0A9P4VVJ1_9PEZI|nr:PDT-domain-containing protein [Patellaria atrata CBS 101060]